MKNTKRAWDVLLIGGSSGSGKTTIAYQLAQYYHINVVKVDAISEALKAVTTEKSLPILHYWNTGVNWMDVGVAANVTWLFNVSVELMPAIKAVVDMHLEDSEPVIIEGDFIHPKLCASINDAKAKSIFIQEPDVDQLINNYLDRENLEQQYRAEISRDHGNQLAEYCRKYNIPILKHDHGILFWKE